MEPFARRPIERTPARRPIMGGSVQRPAILETPATQPATRPSILKPPTLPAAGPSMDIRPTANPIPHPSAPQSHATAQSTPVQQGAFHHNPQPHPATTQPAHFKSQQQAPVARQSKAKEKLNIDLPKHHKPGHSTAHAGLVGFIVFLLIGILCLAPLLSGKIWEGAPGSSDSFSTGDQSLDCLTTLGPVTTATTYNHKIGFPVVYSYATTSQQSATCQSKLLHVIGGHTSQFNPLGLLIDLLLAIVVGVIAAKIWRKLRASKD